MGECEVRTLVERLGELDAADFRVRGRTKHKASEIACMTICAQIAGATSFYDMHSYATEKRKARPVFQRSADSIQRNWPLNAERCAAEHFGRRPLIRGMTLADKGEQSKRVGSGAPHDRKKGRAPPIGSP